jgi:hypothetical protein
MKPIRELAAIFKLKRASMAEMLLREAVKLGI